MVDIKNIYWAAGFLDGEGYFGRTRTCAHITATQVASELLERLQRLFGGIVRHYQRKEVKHNDYYRWDFYGQKAIGLIMTLYPLLSYKRKEQIKKVLLAWKSSPGRGNYPHKSQPKEIRQKISIGMKKFCQNNRHKMDSPPLGGLSSIFAPADFPDGRDGLRPII